MFLSNFRMHSHAGAWEREGRGFTNLCKCPVAQVFQHNLWRWSFASVLANRHIRVSLAFGERYSFPRSRVGMHTNLAKQHAVPENDKAVGIKK